MTREKQDILEDFYAGNYKVLHDTILDASGNPMPLDGCEITFALFDDKNVIHIVKSSVDPTQIDVVGVGEVDIILLPEDSLKLQGLYRYHVNVVDGNGYEETVTTGKIHIFASFARRPRAESVPAYLSG